MSRRAAISPIGTGPLPRRASSASARTAYADLVVMTSKACATLRDGDDGPEEDGPLAPAASLDGSHLRAVRTAEPEFRARLDRPRRSQGDPRQRIRPALLPLVAGDAPA